MKIKQICKECGDTFLRSLYHPQITTCPQCKKGGDKECLYCKYSYKERWDLVCKKTGKVVTTNKSCAYFENEWRMR